MKLADYEDWKRCITIECGIPLTADYVEQRISALEDPNNLHTRKFLNTWGEAHLHKVIGWFKTARQEVSS